MTQTYLKRQIAVKATQFTDQKKDSVYNWAKSIQGNVFHSWDEKGNPVLKIPTLEGEMTCSIGDYLIVEPFPTDWRKLYPCKEEVFVKTYIKAPGIGDLKGDKVSKNIRQEVEGEKVHLFWGNNKYLGYLYMEVDGYYVYVESEKLRGGHWAGYELMEIASIIDDLNKPWDNRVGEYFKRLSGIGHAGEREVMIQAFYKVRQLFQNREWIMDGRGSYPYDDDRYKEEVRYLFDEFEALYSETFSNIKSKTFEYRDEIIKKYEEDKGLEGSGILVDAPIWYTKEEIYNWLRHENYSEQIANELSDKWATSSQFAFEKGWQKRGQQEKDVSVKPGFDIWTKEAINLLHWSSLGADVLSTMCEKVNLTAGAETAKELSENIKSFLSNPSKPPKATAPIISARWVREEIERRISYLKKADAEICKERWDMTQPEFKRLVARDTSNFLTERRRELEDLLKLISADESPRAFPTGWMPGTPKLDKPCVFVSKSGNDYSVWEVLYMSNGDGTYPVRCNGDEYGSYLAICNGNGEEWGDINDFHCDQYYMLYSTDSYEIEQEK